MKPADAPMSYRMAWGGMICGMIILMLFCYKAGMTMGVAIGFVLFYYYISTCITRLRAEFGFPLHDVHFGGPIQMITSAVWDCESVATDACRHAVLLAYQSYLPEPYHAASIGRV